MTDDRQDANLAAAPPSARPSRFQLSNLVAGVVIGGLLVGGIAPLVGGEGAGDATSAPVFAGGEGVAGGTSGDGGSLGEGSSGAVAGSTTDGSTGAVAGGAAGDASAGAGATAGGAVSGGAGTAARKASDVGVTADTIKIGAYVLDCGGCQAIGIPTPSAATTEAWYRAIVDDLNAKGGINGRKVELATARYDPVQDAINGGGTQRAGCLKLTERDKVFAVIGGGVEGNECIYEEHKTPLIAQSDQSDDPQAFNRSGGRLWLTNPSHARSLSDFAHQLVSQQVLTPSTKWGLLYHDENRPKVEGILLADLKKQGLEPTHRTIFANGDAGGLPVRIAQEVPRMRAAGVTHVLMTVDFFTGSSWVREAQRNGWIPQYVISEFVSGAGDLAGSEYAKAGKFDGAIAISTTNDLSVEERASDPVTGPCLAILRKVPGGAEAEPGSDPAICALLGIFKQAVTNAGTNPTRDALAAALARFGEFPMFNLVNKVGSFGGPYRFGPTKFTGARFSQKKVWTSPCPRRTPQNYPGCWVPAGPVKPMAG